VTCMTFLTDCTHLVVTTEATHHSRRPRRAGEGDISFQISAGSLFIPISPSICIFKGVSSLFKPTITPSYLTLLSMPLFTASTRHLYRVLLICLVCWNVSAHGQPAEAALQLEIVKPKLDFLIRRDGIPKSPPWVYPDAVQDPPHCVLDGHCGWESNSIEKCSAEQCVETFIGACEDTATLVDKSCLCASLNSSKCQSQCVSLHWASYLYWLNNTCGDLDNWHGLADGWAQEAKKAAYAELILVGTRTESLLQNYYYDENEVSGYTDTYLPAYQIPQAINNTCPSLWLGRWNSSLYNLTEIQLARGTDTGYDDFDVEEDLYLDQLSFCSNSYDTLPTGCDSGILRTELLLWMAQICNESTKYGWPSNWRESLIVLNSTFLDMSILDSSRPSCFDSQYECQAPLNQTEFNCSSTRCVVDSAGNCSTTTSAVERSCYCKNSTYLDYTLL
jgi:hypothetical protein